MDRCDMYQRMKNQTEASVEKLIINKVLERLCVKIVDGGLYFISSFHFILFLFYFSFSFSIFRTARVRD